MNKKICVIPAKAGIHASVIPAPACPRGAGTGIHLLFLSISIIISLAIFSLAFTPPVSAVSPTDLMAASAGARAQALGQAGVALDQGIFAPFWNPAALNLVPPALVTLDDLGQPPKKGLNLSVGSHYAKLYGEIDRFVLAAGLPWGNFSFDLNYVSESVGDIPLTSSDANGRPVLEGTFSDSQTALAGTMSTTVFNDNFRVGGTLKMVKHSLYQQSVSGYGLDVGATYKITDQITLAAAVRNLLQPKFTWSSGYTDIFARKATAGGSCGLVLAGKPVNILGQIGYEQGSGTDYGLGLEAFLVNWLPIRLGLDKQSLTAGLGLSFGQFVLDYAYRGHSDLGAAHQVSFEFKF